MPEVADRLKGYAALITALAALLAALGGFWKSTNDSRQAELLQEAIFNLQQNKILELESRLAQVEVVEDDGEAKEDAADEIREVSGVAALAPDIARPSAVKAVSSRRVSRDLGIGSIEESLSFDEIRQRVRKDGGIDGISRVPEADTDPGPEPELSAEEGEDSDVVESDGAADAGETDED